ncbi:putative bifunctional diguanylate cyclase/phosphodiesterase [Vallicoccus soli]|uniref:EAL domain-containing protein n=1 Tax=Vallicoccus soli TaxID=2339232 RepID=A0A3A3YZZ8_9ACTN|nr:EAL domain-containing protein [Vallicoccus soli]RJK97550.1 EAL domain-containing protein [Vallicoccus soli]
MSGRPAVDQAALTRVLGEFAATVTGEFDVQDIVRQLAVGVVEVLDVDGAGVMVPAEGELLRFVHATGSRHGSVAQLERVQEVVQDGPCHDAHRDGRVVNIADLPVEGAWPRYMAEAEALGLRAVCAIPLRARGRRWGVMDLYRGSRRRLDEQELQAALMLANLATSYLVVTADRDAARLAQEQLAHRAMHDPLTGLPVRWVFLEQLEHALSRSARVPGRVAVMFLDLDGLKYVNDTYGHEAGDRLLRTCVERVRAALRPTDVVARLGGDEFVVLMEDLEDADVVHGIAQRVLERIAQPYAPDGYVIQPSASIGVALAGEPQQTPDALVARADVAMYQAKQSGRGRYRVFDASSYAADRAQAASLDRLVAALRRPGPPHGRLELHYQPVVDLDAPAGSRTRVHAVEALLRWRHPGQGVLPAGAFLPDAEQGGLLGELGAWVLPTALRQLADWDARLGDAAPRRVFVNVSAQELLGEGFAGRVSAALEAAGLGPHRLTLEITETGLLEDPAAAAAVAAELRAGGCELAIDDFGTGHSSLGRLVAIPATTIKVDRSLVGALAQGEAARAVVAAVLGLGRSLERAVVLEGVEDEAALDELRSLGARLVQGYHLGRPVPPGELEERLTGAAGR